jgi:hypothetical protein
MLYSFMVWLDERKNRHTDWLDDHSKYVDIRFDSRTGDFLVKHEKDGTNLVWVSEVGN